MTDAEAILRAARRPLVLGIGGGGDVVGALATAELSRRYDGSDPLVGGVTWERRPIDPVPGPRAASEIANAETVAPGVLLAGPDTRVRDTGVQFAEAHMAMFLRTSTVLVDINDGVGAVADGLAEAADRLGCDLLAFIDVGGDVLAQGDERGLSSPLCDAMMLAAAARLAREGRTVLAGVFGMGCDAELTPDEVRGLLARVADAGGWAGARGLTEPVAERLEAAMEFVPTEASAQAVRAFRGACGPTTIRDGRRTLELSCDAAVTFYLDVERTVSAVGRLAEAVDGAPDLESANRALNELGVTTELDREIEAAAKLAGR